MNEIKVLDLFSGIGGSCLGMEMAGYNTIGLELNAWAVDRAREAGLDARVCDLHSQNIGSLP